MKNENKKELVLEPKTIAIALPHTGTLNTEVALSFMNLNPGPHRVQFVPLKSSILFISREYLVSSALNEGADYILFLDSDQIVPNDLLIKMTAWMQQGVDILTTLIFRKDPPYHPCVFSSSERLENKQISLKFFDIANIDLNNAFYVENCGLGCAMISRKVFETIPQPWFLPDPYTGEDISFLHKATQEYGFKIVCDPTIPIGHIGFKNFTREDYLKYVEDENRLLNGSVTPEVYL